MIVNSTCQRDRLGHTTSVVDAEAQPRSRTGDSPIPQGSFTPSEAPSDTKLSTHARASSSPCDMR